MTEQPSEKYSFSRYLAAKRSADDRALNRRVLDVLLDVLPSGTPDSPVRVLDVGAGIGGTLERMQEWGVVSHAAYTGLDNQVENLAVAASRLLRADTDWTGDLETNGTLQFDLVIEASHFQVELLAIDLFDFLDQELGARQWDLLVAHAFFDLVDISTTVPRLLKTLAPGGLFYFPITFDGLTAFEPVIDPVFDEAVIASYHRTMDERVINGRRSGGSRSGRSLLRCLCRIGAQLLAVGSSDWVVVPGLDGYPADEAYFLEFILHTVQHALQEDQHLDQQRLSDWLSVRHDQVARGELIYIAHQLDFLGKV